MRKTRKSCFAVGLWLMALGFLPLNAVAETATPPAQPAAVQQAKTVKGHVVDENGEPLVILSHQELDKVSEVFPDLFEPLQ